jgi:poly(A) polymerase
VAIENRLNPALQPWMMAEGVSKVLAAIAADVGEARFVGGAVRDALLGRAVGEVDLAVNLPPEKVMEALKAAGIKAVPTGIDHGTVTAVVDRKGYEITTLRRDVETDGRRAKVAFTDDWQADAARRDFTFNALYADAEGTIYDYFGGREDLAAGRVRFIGDAEARIREDVLRILRYFRFFAWFSRTAADDEALRACQKLASLLPQLSVERVWNEVRKLLLASDPVPAWRLMMENSILPHFLPEAANVTRLAGLIAIENGVAEPDSIRRLAALLPEDVSVSEALTKRLHFSNREAERLRALAVLPGALRGKCDRLLLRKILFEYGAENVRDGLLLLSADESAFDLKAALAIVEKWESPVLPIQGEDLLRLGIPEGPRVGEILRAVEAWWIAKDFRPDKAACLAEAKRIGK